MSKLERKGKRRDPQAPKNVKHLTTLLGCIRCASKWNVVDLNPEHKVVKCPICAEPNDIREAVGRARGKKEFVQEAA